jgi:hypothetical protein
MQACLRGCAEGLNDALLSCVKKCYTAADWDPPVRPGTTTPLWQSLLYAALLLMLSGLFSGLTLGLMVRPTVHLNPVRVVCVLEMDLGPHSLLDADANQGAFSALRRAWTPSACRFWRRLASRMSAVMLPPSCPCASAATYSCARYCSETRLSTVSWPPPPLPSQAIRLRGLLHPPSVDNTRVLPLFDHDNARTAALSTSLTTSLAGGLRRRRRVY